MKLVVVSAAFYPTLGPVKMLWKSAYKFGMEPSFYGLGEPPRDWIYMKVTRLLEHLRLLRAQGYTHALYTDGRDSFFVAGKSEIESKYSRLGTPPCLMSAEVNCWPDGRLGTEFPQTEYVYRYPCAGQFMGEIDFIVDRWQKMFERYDQDPEEPRIDQGWIIKSMLSGELDGLVLDHHCEIFQSAADESVRANRGIARNPVTGSYPCVLHFNGGYMDPETGRAERMLPIWEAVFGDRKSATVS